MKRRDGGAEFFEQLSAVARAVRVAAADAYATHEIGSLQAKCLRVIGAREKLSQAELARATLTDPALIGRVLESLVERGLVKRKRSDADRRQYLLALTAAGQRARDRVVAVRSSVAKRITSALDARDVADFERIAAKILAELDDDER